MSPNAPALREALRRNTDRALTRTATVRMHAGRLSELRG